MTTTAEPALDLAVRNLLMHCGDCRPGDRVLLVHEPVDTGFYDPALIPAVAGAATRLGLTPVLFEDTFEPDIATPGNALQSAMEAADQTVFMARRGDQIRYRTPAGMARVIVCYALDVEMLTTAFGTADHRGFLALKRLVDRHLRAAGTIHVTCPEGTDFTGDFGRTGPPPQDVGLQRFPMSVFTPAPAGGFAGQLVQRGFLVGTGATYYQPYACALAQPMTVHFAGGRITGLEGDPVDVAAARAHYTQVADNLGLDPWTVHSWHAGIHPGCDFPDPAARSFERWSGGAFGNPRVLHFHTCGTTPPGEISLNVIDATVRVDGVALWQDGVLHPDRLPGGADLLGRFPCVAAAFEHPAQNVGLGPDGHLSFYAST